MKALGRGLINAVVVALISFKEKYSRKDNSTTGRKEYSKITLEQLKELNACSPALEVFEETFGREATAKEVLDELRKEKFATWEAWLLAQSPELTKALLDNGADIHADTDGAICWASRKGRVEVVKLLLDRGADVHAYQDSPLRSAAENGYAEVVRLLLDYGANVNACENAALKLATVNGHIGIVALLKKH